MDCTARDEVLSDEYLLGEIFRHIDDLEGHPAAVPTTARIAGVCRTWRRVLDGESERRDFAEWLSTGDVLGEPISGMICRVYTMAKRMQLYQLGHAIRRSMLAEQLERSDPPRVRNAIWRLTCGEFSEHPWHIFRYAAGAVIAAGIGPGGDADAPALIATAVFSELVLAHPSAKATSEQWHPIGTSAPTASIPLNVFIESSVGRSAAPWDLIVDEYTESIAPMTYGDRVNNTLLVALIDTYPPRVGPEPPPPHARDYAAEYGSRLIEMARCALGTEYDAVGVSEEHGDDQDRIHRATSIYSTPICLARHAPFFRPSVSELIAKSFTCDGFDATSVSEMIAELSEESIQDLPTTLAVIRLGSARCSAAGRYAESHVAPRLILPMVLYAVEPARLLAEIGDIEWLTIWKRRLLAVIPAHDAQQEIDATIGGFRQQLGELTAIRAQAILTGQ